MQGRNMELVEEIEREQTVIKRSADKAEGEEGMGEKKGDGGVLGVDEIVYL